jgi:peptidoglycan hydrolase-like protein with peptidoglycan-binding domain
VAIPFTASKHPRGAGGLFAATAAANGKPTGAWAAGPVQSGAAHGGKTDPRVKALQQALNKLGITDERGRPLLVDGKPGAHTSAAIKKWQSAQGERASPGTAPAGGQEDRLEEAAHQRAEDRRC